MTQLTQLNNYAESTVAQLYGRATVSEIRTHFALITRRAEELLHEIKLAEDLSHLVNSEAIPTEAVNVVREAVKYIITNSDSMVMDLHFINTSGIHNIENGEHLNYILATLFDRADELKRGSGIKAWFAAKFKRGGTFVKQYNAVLAKEKSETELDLSQTPEAA